MKARPNSSGLNGVVQGRLQLVPKKGTTITAFGSYYMFNGQSVTNSIMNYKLAPTSNSATLRSYVAFKQRLKDKKIEEGDEQKAALRNAWYNVRVDYQSSTGETYDSEHKDKMFDYGYIGRFESYNTEAFAYRNYDQAQQKKAMLLFQLPATNFMVSL